MARGVNAQLAVDEYHRLRQRHSYPVSEAWKGIAELLLSCDIQAARAWQPFHKVVVYRESNDFKLGADGLPGGTIRKAERLSSFLAAQLSCTRDELCARIGAYWRLPLVSQLQYHNLVGNAFRSIVSEILVHYGSPGIRYEEEVHAADLFRSWPLRSRSKEPMIDIVAFKGPRPVAMLSTRWRYRHDRVDFIDEAHAYSAAGLRMFGGIPFYAVTGEFSPARVGKVLDNAPPASQGPISAAVHFYPALITDGLGENGRMAHLKSLEWLVAQTESW